jgi:hypothetical protein
VAWMERLQGAIQNGGEHVINWRQFDLEILRIDEIRHRASFLFRTLDSLVFSPDRFHQSEFSTSTVYFLQWDGPSANSQMISHSSVFSIHCITLRNAIVPIREPRKFRLDCPSDSLRLPIVLTCWGHVLQN